MRLFLAPRVGTGTPGDSYRPQGCYADVVGVWAAFRFAPTLFIVAADGATSAPNGTVDLGDNVHDLLTGQLATVVSNQFNLQTDQVSGYTPGQIVIENQLGNPVRNAVFQGTFTARRRIYLGRHLLVDAPPVVSGGMASKKRLDSDLRFGHWPETTYTDDTDITGYRNWAAITGMTSPRLFDKGGTFGLVATNTTAGETMYGAYWNSDIGTADHVFHWEGSNAGGDSNDANAFTVAGIIRMSGAAHSGYEFRPKYWNSTSNYSRHIIEVTTGTETSIAEMNSSDSEGGGYACASGDYIWGNFGGRSIGEAAGIGVTDTTHQTGQKFGFRVKGNDETGGNYVYAFGWGRTDDERVSIVSTSSVSTSSSSATSITFTAPSGIQDGDLLVAAVCFNDETALGSWTPASANNPADGWDDLYETHQSYGTGFSGQRAWLFAKRADGESGNYQFDWSVEGSGTHAAGIMVCIRGCKRMTQQVDGAQTGAYPGVYAADTINTNFRSSDIYGESNPIYPWKPALTGSLHASNNQACWGSKALSFLFTQGKRAEGATVPWQHEMVVAKDSTGGGGPSGHCGVACAAVNQFDPLYDHDHDLSGAAAGQWDMTTDAWACEAVLFDGYGTDPWQKNYPQKRPSTLLRM